MMPTLDLPHLTQTLQKLPEIRLGVLGDFVLDGYWETDMTRSQLSRETPLFNRPVVAERYSLGAAANVAWNLASLGVQTVAFTTVGVDWRWTLLRELLQKEHIDTDPILIQTGWTTPFYGKVILTGYDSKQEDSRFDFINPHPLPAVASRTLLASLERELPTLDGVIVADYFLNGVVDEVIRAGLANLRQIAPDKIWIVDSRDRAQYFDGFILKPNRVEASGFFFPGQDPAQVPLEALAKAGQMHAARTRQPVVITLGGEGCLACQPGSVAHLAGIRVTDPIDPVGAGDTFVASLAAALAAGLPLEQACEMGNLGSSVSVRKLGVTGAASPEEIIHALEAQHGAH